MSGSGSLQTLALLLALGVTGCAHLAGNAAKQVAKEAEAPAIDVALRTLTEPENQRLLGELLANPAVEDAAGASLRASPTARSPTRSDRRG